jgi:chromosome segregation ATPase
MTGIKTELGAANSQLQGLRSEKSLLSAKLEVMQERNA